MNKPSYRAARLVTLGVGLVFLLGACGEPTPEGGEQQQQGSVTPPAAADQSTAETTTEDTQTSQ